jgi:hypothetical protein
MHISPFTIGMTMVVHLSLTFYLSPTMLEVSKPLKPPTPSLWAWWTILCDTYSPFSRPRHKPDRDFLTFAIYLPAFTVWTY